MEKLLMDADMRPTQRLVLACQQAAQLLERALEATKEIKAETNQKGKRRYNHGKKANQQVNHNDEIICLHCYKPGHVAKECWRRIGACLRCGNSRHQLRDCPLLEESATSVKDLNSMTKRKRLNSGVVGETPLEETVESDSERGE
ncbi:hypothetical protein Taro_056316 [Colocasia esculenta]|uniref:CCHC-type domain-containing protein n=1 Tax=Colocasia esculenta TaxID=4460 RepID=A0A843XTL3_COLES|nr:hypothetical protein [Colocasia esculenta]